MSKSIDISKKQWDRLQNKLKEDYPLSSIIIRSKMKTVLGFVPREYKDWDPNIGKYGGWRKNTIMLDFYSEKKQTWFMIKYSEYLQKDQAHERL